MILNDLIKSELPLGVGADSPIVPLCTTNPRICIPSLFKKKSFFRCGGGGQVTLQLPPPPYIRFWTQKCYHSIVLHLCLFVASISKFCHSSFPWWYDHFIVGGLGWRYTSIIVFEIENDVIQLCLICAYLCRKSQNLCSILSQDIGFSFWRIRYPGSPISAFWAKRRVM